MDFAVDLDVLHRLGAGFGFFPRAGVDGQRPVPSFKPVLESVVTPSLTVHGRDRWAVLTCGPSHNFI